MKMKMAIAIRSIAKLNRNGVYGEALSLWPLLRARYETSILTPVSYTHLTLPTSDLV